MAADLNHPDHSPLHLLPSQFLDQDYDAVLSVNKSGSGSAKNSFRSWFGSTDSGSSVLSSPVASELGSTEETTESDPDEDYMAELTRRMAQYMLQDEDLKQERTWASVVSPQLTLRSPLGSKLESSKAPSREPSPPLPSIIEEFEKMKINNNNNNNNNRDMFCCNFSEITSTVRTPNAEFHSKQALIDDQIRAIQFYRLDLEPEQAMKQHKQHKKHRKQKPKQHQSKQRASGKVNNNCQKTNNIRPPASTSTPSSATTKQQQPSSGMKAVFLNGPGSKTVSSGTGVFLPQGVGYPSESRKKQGCSTVLIPARVVQALKQHFDKVGIPSRFSYCLPVQNDGGGFMGVKNSLYSQQQRHSWAVPASNHQDMNLPQEWTY